MKVLSSKGQECCSDVKVFLAIPSYGGISEGLCYSLFTSKEILLKAGVRSDIAIFAGNCHIDDARNRLVRDFLETDCTDFIFLDADLRFDPHDLLDLALADKDVIGSTYRLKMDVEEYPVRFISGDIVSDKTGHIEVESIPTGFLKIKRHVLQKLYDKVQRFKIKEFSGRLEIPVIFERTLENGIRWGGDYEFCRKWRDIGGKIYLFPEMILGHIGVKEWTGSVGNHLRNINGLQDSYIKEIIKKVKNGEPTVKDMIGLCHAWNNEWVTTEEILITLSMTAGEAQNDILECGSGLSTLIIAAAANKKVDVLEHDKQYLNEITKYIKLCGLDNVNIHFCKIKDNWYDFDMRGKQYGMVYVDGPSMNIGRAGFAMNIRNHITNDCILVADDYDLETIEKWQESLNFEYKKTGTQRPFIVGKITSARSNSPTDN